MQSEQNEIRIECAECGEDYPLSMVLADQVRFHCVGGEGDGAIAYIPDDITIEQLKEQRLICECCQEEMNERNEC